MTENKFYYGIRVATGDIPNAKADTHSVKIMLTGSKGTSNEMHAKAKEYLFFQSHFTRGSYEDLVIESEGDLGDVLIVKASLGDLGWIDHISLIDFAGVLTNYSFVAVSPQWFIDFITVYNFQDDAIINFPCYHWIGHDKPGIECTSKTGKSRPTLIKRISGQLLLLLCTITIANTKMAIYISLMLL